MKFKLKFVFLVSLIVILALSIFYFKIYMPKKSIGKETNIVVVFKDYKSISEFWKVLKAGIETAEKEYGINVEFTGSNSENDVEGQKHLLEALILKKPSAIILAATDYNALVPVAEKIKKAGITLITMDSGISSDVSDSFIATDNMEAGKKAGSELLQIVDKKLTFAIVSYVKGSATAIEREKGVLQGLGSINSKRIIGTFFCNSDISTSYQITTKLIKDNPNLGGIVALNENSAVGVAEAIKDLGLGGKVKVVGFDNSIDEVSLIEESVIQATMVQKPFNIGYLATKTAIQCLKGEKIQKKINTGSELISKETMYTYKNQKLLFPFID